ncbi:MAG: SRPBCC domain-containing protein [Nakamurella sp.]
MTVISCTPNEDELALTLTAEFTASSQQIWELWSNPRKLEQWWGPPTYPATFTELELAKGGRAAYYMTGPDGEKLGGQWDILTADATDTIAFDDFFADEQGNRNDSLPTSHTVVTISGTGDLTRMVIRSSFDSAEDMRQLLEMGMVEGFSLAVGQIDAILAE